MSDVCIREFGWSASQQLLVIGMVCRANSFDSRAGNTSDRGNLVRGFARIMEREDMGSLFWGESFHGVGCWM
jgi:hypothetical protein